MIAKVVDESGEIVCIQNLVPLRSLERNVARGTVSLLVPSGSYTLVVEGATRDEEDGKLFHIQMMMMINFYQLKNILIRRKKFERLLIVS